jgi:hypothetical protein
LAKNVRNLVTLLAFPFHGLKLCIFFGDAFGLDAVENDPVPSSRLPESGKKHNNKFLTSKKAPAKKMNFWNTQLQV